MNMRSWSQNKLKKKGENLKYPKGNLFADYTQLPFYYINDTITIITVTHWDINILCMLDI